MGTQDLIGKRGESIAAFRLMDSYGKTGPYFDVHPLGEKCPTFDYLVELRNAGHSPPYFFVQVKTTQKRYTKKGHLKAEVTADDVQRMVHCPMPTYLVGVDAATKMAYVVSVHGKMSGPIASIPTTYPLDEKNLKTLWDEVAAYWQNLDASKKASVFLFEDQGDGG